MSAQFKLDRVSNPDKDNKTSFNQNKRPNIDHLLKRIIEERRKERRSTQIVLAFVFLGIFAISLVIFQN